jgi:putative ATP-binding cassette transporter
MREALAYPSEPDQIKDKAFRDALTDLNLKELEPGLDKRRDWREELNEDQLTRLAFVRMLIHEPSWILIDEVLDFVDAYSRALITGALGKRLKSSAVIHIGRRLPNDGTFRTFVHVINDTSVRKLPRRKGRRDNRIVASSARR